MDGVGQMIRLVDEKKRKAIDKFKEGFTWVETAQSLGIGVATLFRWASSDPEFRAAVDEAKSDPDGEVEAVTFANACNPDPAHNTLRMFWLNSRRGYKHRADVTSDDKPVQPIFRRIDNPRDEMVRSSAPPNGVQHH